MSKKSGSNLFLMEMLVVVLFFILCASTCILVFVKSNNMSSLAKDTNQSVIVSESIAEFFKAGRMDLCSEEMKARIGEDGSYEILLDRDWNYITDEEVCAYKADISVVKEAGMENALIRITRIRDAMVLYELDVSSYRGAGTAVY